jgi:hypothetical protein
MTSIKRNRISINKDKRLAKIIQLKNIKIKNKKREKMKVHKIIKKHIKNLHIIVQNINNRHSHNVSNSPNKNRSSSNVINNNISIINSSKIIKLKETMMLYLNVKINEIEINTLIQLMIKKKKITKMKRDKDLDNINYKLIIQQLPLSKQMKK